VRVLTAPQSTGMLVCSSIWRCTAQSIQKAARAALENPRLVGEPEIRETGGATDRQADQQMAPVGFDMGSAVPVR